MKDAHYNLLKMLILLSVLTLCSSFVMSPSYSLNSTNSKVAGTNITHSLYWTDNINLSTYIFQFCNGTWNGTSCGSVGSDTTSWADSNCNYRRKLSFTTPFGSTSLTNFPALVVLNTARINYTQTSTNDIRFYDSDNTTLLKKETELWNSSSNSYIWVKISTLENTNDFIWTYYNCSNTNTDDATNVWDSNYKTVQHMEESTGVIKDSTINGKNFTQSGTVTYNAAGHVGNAIAFDGKDDYATLTYAGLSTQTFELTFNSRAFPVGMNQYLTDEGSNVYQLQLYDGDDNDGKPVIGFDSQFGVPPTEYTAAQQWYHIVAIWYSNSSGLVYLNGTLAMTYTGTNFNSTTITLAKYGGGSTNYFNGTLDEVRASNIVRSRSWVNATFLTESDKLINYGPEVVKSSLVSNWVNDTSVTFGGTGNWSNVTKAINSTVGLTYAWCVYANDTANNWNVSSCINPFTYVSATIPDSLSFTIGYPAQGCTEGNGSTDAGVTCDRCAFITTDNVGLASQTNVSCEGQDITVGFLKLSNTGNVALNFTANVMNGTVDTNHFRVKVSQSATGWEAACSGGEPTAGCVTIESSTFSLIKSNLGVGSFVNIWLFSDFINAAIEDIKAYSMNVTSAKY